MTDHQTTPPADAPERMEFNVPPFYDTPTAYVRLDLYDAQAARIAELEAALVAADALVSTMMKYGHNEASKLDVVESLNAYGTSRAALKGTTNDT